MVRWCSVSSLHSSLRTPAARLIPYGKVKDITLKHLFLREINYPKRKRLTDTKSPPMEWSCHIILSYEGQSEVLLALKRTSNLLHNIYFKFYFLYSYMYKESSSSTWLFWKSHFPELQLFHHHHSSDITIFNS